MHSSVVDISSSKQQIATYVILCLMPFIVLSHPLSSITSGSYRSKEGNAEAEYGLFKVLHRLNYIQSFASFNTGTILLNALQLTFLVCNIPYTYIAQNFARGSFGNSGDFQ